MQKKNRVYVDGIWDLFHHGHVSFLKKCKERADILIVGVCNDSDSESYKRRPVITMEERIKVLKGCKYVDEIIPSCPCNGLTKEFIEKNKIDLVLHANDYSIDKMNKYYSVPIEMGIFETLNYTQTISTTDIINRLTNRILNKYLNGHDDNI